MFSSGNHITDAIISGIGILLAFFAGLLHVFASWLPTLALLTSIFLTLARLVDTPVLQRWRRRMRVQKKRRPIKK